MNWKTYTGKFSHSHRSGITKIFNIDLCSEEKVISILKLNKILFVQQQSCHFAVGRDPECIESALSSGAIRGEANLLRFFFRTFNLAGYESNSDAVQSAKVDSQLDSIHAELFWGDEKTFSKKLDDLLKKDEFLGGRGGPNAADFLAFSALEGKKNSGNIQTWVKKCKTAFA